MGDQGIESGRGQVYWVMWAVWWVIRGELFCKIWDIEGWVAEAALVSASMSGFVGSGDGGAVVVGDFVREFANDVTISLVADAVGEAMIQVLQFWLKIGAGYSYYALDCVDIIGRAKTS